MKNKHGGDIYLYENIVDFSANINPFGTPERVLERIRKSLDHLTDYPDVRCDRLKRALAAGYGCPKDFLIIGNGAAELIYTLVLAVCPKSALVTAPGFAEYEEALQMCGTQVRVWNLQEAEDFCLTDAYLDALTPELDMVFLCSPNNPTGQRIDTELLKQIVKRCEALEILLVVDECFLDFTGEEAAYSMCAETVTYQHLFVLRSFTKMYGLAGLRLGYGICSDENLLEQMEYFRQPWSVSIPAQEAGLAVLEEEQYAEQTRKWIAEERRWMCEQLSKLSVTYWKPEANFIFFRSVPGLKEMLLKEGILIRDCSNYRNLGRGYYRVAVKLREDNKKLLDALARVLKTFSENDHYIYKDQKKLRCGYTTGSCAAGAAKAAAGMLLGNCLTETIRLTTPKGIELCLDIDDISREMDQVRCGVRKDGGDDFDVTHGLMIYAVVQRTEVPGEITIDGGAGVGRVTKEGLDQPIGSAAINSVPRRMIREALEEVMRDCAYEGGLNVQIEVPEGDKTAAHTFNPRLGIVGGISILGTSGIVEPMSEQALLDTIQVELRMRQAEGRKSVLITPGNYGLDFVRGNTELSSEIAVKCSNFIGETLDLCISCGFRQVLLIGHIGKIVKLGAGIMQTHSRSADGRMETLAACGIEAEIPYSVLKELLKCNTTDEAVELLKENGMLEPVMNQLMNRIEIAMEHRTAGKIQTAVIVFSNKYGLLGMTSKAEEMLQSPEFLPGTNE